MREPWLWVYCCRTGILYVTAYALLSIWMVACCLGLNLGEIPDISSSLEPTRFGTAPCFGKDQNIQFLRQTVMIIDGKNVLGIVSWLAYLRWEILIFSPIGALFPLNFLYIALKRELSITECFFVNVRPRNGLCTGDLGGHRIVKDWYKCGHHRVHVRGVLTGLRSLHGRHTEREESSGDTTCPVGLYVATKQHACHLFKCRFFLEMSSLISAFQFDF